MVQISDNELIDRCKKGEMDCYRLVYERYAKAMYHTCLRMVGEPADAEDLVQEGFLEAFAGLERLKDSRAFGGWIKRIMINRSINYIKRQRRNWQELDSNMVSQATEDEPFDEDAFSTRIQAVHQELAQLPVSQRVVISLHVYEDLGFEEIAQLMKVPSATVRSHYSRGRRRILNRIKS